MKEGNVSGSSSKKVDKDEKGYKVLKPKWLPSFLEKEFFGCCKIHYKLLKQLNVYCITCNEPICQCCATHPTHDLHQTLQIYRVGFKNAVPLDAMEKLIDCSEIQPYKSNKNWVIALEPLPHTGSLRWCEGNLCNICRRKLTDPVLYRYCSISCKVQAVLMKPDSSDPPFISLERDRKDQTAGASTEEAAGTSGDQTAGASTEETAGTSKDQTAGASKRLRKRKRTPTRAPFF